MHLRFLFLTLAVFAAVSFGEVAFAGLDQSDAVKVEEKYATPLEDIFHSAAVKNYEEAHNLLTKEFQEITTIEELEKLISSMGLDACVEKKWTHKKLGVLGLTATIDGECSLLDTTIRNFTFGLTYQGKGYKINSISQSIALGELRKKFPGKEKMRTLIQQDLKVITDAIIHTHPKSLFNYLSEAGQKHLTYKDVRTAIMHFKKQHISSFKVLEKDDVSLFHRFPTINNLGQMVIQGSYKNATNKIRFALYYDYQWEWKLGGFEFKVAPDK